MEIRLAQKPSSNPRGNALIIAAFSKADVAKHLLFVSLPKSDRAFLLSALGTGTFDERTARVFLLPSNPQNRLLLLCLGDPKRFQRRKSDVALRRIIASLKEANVSRGTLLLTDIVLRGEKTEDALRRAAINILLADFQFTKYKEAPKEGWPKISEITFIAPRDTKHEQALREGIIIGEETNHCRILANTPGGDMTPSKLAAAAIAEKKRAGAKLTVRVLDEKAMRKLSMGGVLGVGKGSADKPRFIILEFHGGPKTQKPLVFCGKGVTFDTGGLNLKPETAILEMHMDMSGGAAVIHALSAIARLGLKVNVVGLIPAVENMPSGSSYRPGDLLKTITGKTIEVLNTDAEGRVILADALGYAQRYQPKLIVDVATLTGAAMVALGQRMIALFTQDPKLEALGRTIGEQSGDDVWPLPLWDEYLEDIRGTFGDVANTGKNRYGGAITAAMFLRQFVGDYPWMHLDIAPTMTSIEGQCLAKGATGTGVRFLVELAREYSKK